MIKLKDKKELYQWDLGVKLELFNEPTSIDEVHFSNSTTNDALVVKVLLGEAEIPNILLTEPKEINYYLYNSSSNITIKRGTLYVIPRSKPSDYVYTPTEVLNYETVLSIAQSVRDNADLFIAKASGAIYTQLQKIKKIPSTANNAYIRVHLHGISAYSASDNLYLKLYRRASARGKAGRWGYADRWGYAQIAGTTQTWLAYEKVNSITHPEVPSWMPNNGYVQDEIAITQADIEAGYKDIDLCTYLLPLVKPRSVSESIKYLMFGVGLYHTHEITWHLMKGGALLGTATNTVKVGVVCKDGYAGGINVLNTDTPAATRIERSKLWVRLN